MDKPVNNKIFFVPRYQTLDPLLGGIPPYWVPSKIQSVHLLPRSSYILVLLSKHIILPNINLQRQFNPFRCWNSLMTIITIPNFPEKLIPTYNSYSLNATTISFVFIWILVVHACVLLINNCISPSSKTYSTSLLFRTPTSNFWLVLDVYTNIIFGKFHRV